MRKEGGREGRAKVALAARRLLSLAKEVEGVDGADEVSRDPEMTAIPPAELTCRTH